MCLCVYSCKNEGTQVHEGGKACLRTFSHTGLFRFTGIEKRISMVKTDCLQISTLHFVQR